MPHLNHENWIDRETTAAYSMNRSQDSSVRKTIGWITWFQFPAGTQFLIFNISFRAAMGRMYPVGI
jgi:hypothetical protein